MELPKELAEWVGSGEWKKETIGYSGAETYRIRNLANHRNGYLKILAPTPFSSLQPEKDVMEWLKGRLPAPEVYYYADTGRLQFLLMSEIPGRHAADGRYMEDPVKTVYLLAGALQMLHSLDIRACPFDRRLDCRLREAERRVVEGISCPAGAKPEDRLRKAEIILKEVKRRRPKEEELVFTHGDYCLPNILIHCGKLSGFIDLGRAGVADRYQDLALASRSLLYNLGDKKYPELFFDAYGVDRPDREKIEYYCLLDDLF